MRTTIIRLLALVLGSLGLMSLAAETRPFPFFRDGPSFIPANHSSESSLEAGWQPVMSSIHWFPALEAWTVGAHILNQSDSPWFGHELTTAIDLKLLASEALSLGFAVSKAYLFRVNPDGQWLLWARALLTDLAVHLDLNLKAAIDHWTAFPTWPEAALTINFRHSCKHDMEAYYGRTAVHDALSLTLYQALPSWKPLPAWQMRTELRVSVEHYLEKIFQELSPEPYLTRLAAEVRWFPLILAEKWRLFIEGRYAALACQSGSAVALEAGWYNDWRVDLGAELVGEAGRLRVSYYQEFSSDPLVDNHPVPSLIRAVSLGLIFATP